MRRVARAPKCDSTVLNGTWSESWTMSANNLGVHARSARPITARRSTHARVYVRLGVHSGAARSQHGHGATSPSSV